MQSNHPKHFDIQKRNHLMKSNNNRRVFAWLLTLCAALPVLASCGGETPAADTTAADSTVTTAPEDTTISDDLGEYDFGGEDYNMLIREWKIKDLFVEESIGEVYNDAVYDRNRKIEERFNINYTMQTLPE